MTLSPEDLAEISGSFVAAGGIGVDTVAGATNDECLVCGVDEAGRGPLAGPVYAAAVILHPDYPVAGLADSKSLTALQRERLAPLIKENALAWAIAASSVQEIDHINILQATMLAMMRAVQALPVVPREALIDGNRCPRLAVPARAIIKGDQSVPAISAASILAKTARDAAMRELASEFPGYGFERHKGYGTNEHMAALTQFGPLPCHRLSFAPVAAAARLHAKPR